MPNNPITDNNIKKKPTKIQANAAVNNHVSMHTTPHNNNNNNYN
jgi:hypothetical protein